MKKEDFAALGISEELAKKAEEASANELKGFVPKSRFDEVNEAKKALETAKTEIEGQLETLKKSNGNNEELKAQIAKLQEDNKLKDTEYQEKLKDLQMTNAIKLAISATAQDSDLVTGLIDKTKLILSDDGKITGLDEQIKALKESKAFLFKQETSAGGSKAGFTVGAAGGSTGGLSVVGEGKQLSMKEAILAKLQSQIKE